MKKACLLIFLFIGILTGNAQKSDLDLYDYWTHYGDMSDNLYKHLSSIAFEQINKRTLYLSGLNTDEQRRQYAVDIKAKLEKAMGVFPEKTPLNPVITGKLKRDNFVVEKFYFESRPGYHVTAALFIPTKVKGKKPAVIYCCGHTAESFRSIAYQTCILNYVEKGFVVLAFDPVGQGERVQYFNEKGKPFFFPTQEHSYPGTQSFISGMPLANYFVWDGIRAIDYLMSRKEVDPQRIGITGRSGGGTQAAYIAAMDDRVTAAAPECYITTYNRLLRSEGPQDAEQILMNSLKEGIDIADLLHARASKPTLIISTTRDFFSIQGAREAFHEAQVTYKAFGKSENLLMVEDDDMHASTKKNREAAYAFFQKQLNNPGSYEEVTIEPFDVKELWVTPDGQIQYLLNSETIFSLNKKYTDELLANRQKENSSNTNYNHELKNKVIKLSGYEESTFSGDYIFSGRVWRDTYSIERYLVKGVGNYYLPLLHLRPTGEIKETILLLDEQGKKFAVNEGLADKLAEKGYEIIVPDLTGIGELGGGCKKGDDTIDGIPLNVWYAGILTHKSPVAVRMEEIGIILDFVNEIKEATPQITGIACGTLTSDLLHSMAIEKRLDKIVLVNPLYSYLSVVNEKNYQTKYVMSAVPGMLSEYDLQDLVRAVSSDRILLINPVDGTGKPIGTTRETNEYSIVNISDTDILSTIEKWLIKEEVYIPKNKEVAPKVFWIPSHS